MALDGLLQAIAADGDSEARQVLETAAAEASAIRAAADAQAAERSAVVCAAREAELRSALDTKRARARSEASVQVLLARKDFLDRIFGEAESRLPGMLERTASPDVLVSLCREALEFLPPNAARIRCRGSLARRLGTTLGTVPVVADDGIPEGVIAESLDGSSRVDNTLRSRLHRRRPELSIAILTAASGDA